jgi:hypothetical protein
MNGKFWGNVGLSAVVFSLVAFGVTKISASPTGIAGVLLPEITVSDSAEKLLHSVALTSSFVKVSKTGHMVDASFAIENKGARDIKNVSILCTLFDDTGKEQGRDKWVIFKTVKSQDSGVFTFTDKMFISNTVIRSDCEIVDLHIAKAPKGNVHHGAPVEHGSTTHDTGQNTKH